MLFLTLVELVYLFGMSRVISLILFLCGAFTACRGDQHAAVLATGDSVQLVRAVKGHELVVEKQGQTAKIRLVGIYTFDPQVQEQSDITRYGKRAVDFVQTKTQGVPLRVVLERQAPDPRGRYLGFVELAGVDLGRRLIDEGYAAIYTEYPFSREANYFAAEASAREVGRGLWGGGAARKRVRALRETWASVRARAGSGAISDPLSESAR